MPVIIRLDGCHFHTFTKGFQKPFDKVLMNSMQDTMLELCKNIQGAVFGYTQSDEITIVLVDYQTLDTQCWLDDRVEKMCSIAASMACRFFNQFFAKNVENCESILSDLDSESIEKFKKVYRRKLFTADFDCRVFNVPKDDACNCVIWRQKDAERNSIQMLAQSLYSHKELMGLSCNALQNKMFTEKGINWNELPTDCKRGASCKKQEDGKWYIDKDMPILQYDRDYFESCIFFDDED